jgi:peptide/nickel transport system substrate-binding protein
MTNSAVNLDPRVGADEASQKAHQLLYNSLVHLDTNLTVATELAESLQRPDPVTYVARLRHGVRFHDGSDLTAKDVAYTFRSFLDPAFRGRSGAYTNVQSVEIVDPYTVAFHLKTPSASFPINLVMGIVKDGSGAIMPLSPPAVTSLNCSIVMRSLPLAALGKATAPESCCAPYTRYGKRLSVLT